MIGRATTLLVWALLAAMVVAGSIVARLSEEGFPGVGAVVKRVTISRVGRGVLVLAWMWLGWHAFAR
jgi:Family of unknown function (DUF6186)